MNVRQYGHSAIDQWADVNWHIAVTLQCPQVKGKWPFLEGIAWQ